MTVFIMTKLKPEAMKNVTRIDTMARIYVLKGPIAITDSNEAFNTKMRTVYFFTNFAAFLASSVCLSIIV